MRHTFLYIETMLALVIAFFMGKDAEVLHLLTGSMRKMPAQGQWH